MIGLSIVFSVLPGPTYSTTLITVSGPCCISGCFSSVRTSVSFFKIISTFVRIYCCFFEKFKRLFNRCILFSTLFSSLFTILCSSYKKFSTLSDLFSGLFFMTVLSSCSSGFNKFKALHKFFISFTFRC